MLIADRYELDELPLGKGGMGAVHRGHDLHLDRRVAVKFLHLPGGPDEELEQRFIREARILARLEHAGAPTLYDFGAYDHRLFQVMQFVDGVTVADLISEHGPVPVPWAAAVAAQACAVLSAAHALSICHRDLKPTNLMLCPDGAVKVLDFGLAVLRDTDVAQFTRAGQILGTPAYMAPEQIQQGVAGPRSDLYALGCVLHEMLTGRQLFTGPTAYAVFEKQVKQAPPPVHGVPAELDDLVQDLLKKDPEDRPADAGVLYERLQSFADELPMLPGFLDPASTPSPGRMYARIIGRVPGGA
ncbi:non-specific serine/threonine protein kinase [Saccharopolyspora erythraea NRRL 2338]|uniref:non-specific serine/threonine protein kinase n=3 Tax=Saccharopolyspora erythraea TaxID=1836 RepID=A4FP06_SACEN|nr:serine/threonine-protein kinase [Saccharopolyspora erythraea]PFG99423.1 non-specific serine/threonine protein kinase [Saccharopolyspora erythraea NRRL 2338]QRK89335.1 serine/threonine protein kinase [Saccharopolyspora erythraea]CAM05781.1 putative serine/threonine protein kinase [Saccharopolyspora erythraea NRRL 2338]